MPNPVRKRSFEQAAHQPAKGSVDTDTVQQRDLDRLLGYGRISREVGQLVNVNGARLILG
jgi:hypothetical protein